MVNTIIEFIEEFCKGLTFVYRQNGHPRFVCLCDSCLYLAQGKNW